jgi:amino acid transporter
MREHRAETREDLTGDTALLQHERRKLRRSLFRFDVSFLIVAAMFVPDTIAQISTNGPQALTWLVIVAATFLIPYGLVMAEFGSTFPLQGGLYEWSSWPSAGFGPGWPPSCTGSSTRSGSADRWPLSLPRR